MNSQLVVQNTAANLDRVAEVVRIVWDHVMPSQIALTLHVFEAGAPLLRSVMENASADQDHTSLLNQLVADIPSGKVVDLGTCTMAAEPGKKVLLQSGCDQAALRESSGKEPGTRTFGRHESFTGTALEIDPRIKLGGAQVELVCDFRHALAHARKTETPFHHQATLPMRPGTARVLAIWAPVTGEKTTGKGTQRIAIIQVGLGK